MKKKARAIFELLIPNDFKARLKRHFNILWVLDKYTAKFPWELLQDNGKQTQPLCINAGMLRQLATGDSRINIEPVSDNAALVVGDPDLKGFVNQLPGALAEAKAVIEIFEAEKYVTRSLLRESPEVIIPALVSTNYKIIHLAGHGVFNADPDLPSGMVIGKNTFLTTAEIAQMSTTPELVFVNCCFLGKMDGIAEEFFRSRFSLAANIGTQLIENGVKAVIVAGWAVDDAAALAFAKKFYEGMFQGREFGDAAKIARAHIYDPNIKNNTWGAYQCYGDPFYKLKERAWTKKERHYVVASQAEIELSNLLSDIKSGETKNALENLLAISAEVDLQEIRTPAITELEAMIFKELNLFDKAIEKFEQLLASPDASYSLTAIEQYCNISIKQIARISKEKPSAALEKKYDKVMADLDALVQLSPTAERYNIIGSAWKRKLGLFTNSHEETQRMLAESLKNYYRAYLKNDKDSVVYAYTNWLTLQNILVLAGIQSWGEKLEDVQDGFPNELPMHSDITLMLSQMEAQLKKPIIEKYWDRIVVPNIKLCTWMLSATVEPKIDKMPPSDTVSDAYLSVWKQAGSTNEKQVEIDHLELVICAIEALARGHFIIKDLNVLLNHLKAAM